MHIAATFAELADRGYLRIGEVAGAEPDWLIIQIREHLAMGPAEACCGMRKPAARGFGRADHVLLSQLSRTSAAAIGTAYVQLSHGAAAASSKIR